MRIATNSPHHHSHSLCTITPSRASSMLLPITLLSFSWFASVQAGSQTHGQNCSTGANRLQVGTYQLYTQCDTVTFCNSSGLCDLKRCRRDDFPFGYPQDSDSIPPKCPRGQFCPDEEDACQPLLPVGSACQLNRDGERSCCALKYVKTDHLQINAKLRITMPNWPIIPPMVLILMALFVLTMSACTLIYLISRPS